MFNSSEFHFFGSTSYEIHILVVGTQMSNNQQQLATQEFSTSSGSLYTRYLIVMCVYANI